MVFMLFLVKSLVVEIFEDCLLIFELFSVIKKMVQFGYKIVLDDFILSNDWKVFLFYILIIKFDICFVFILKVKFFINKLCFMKIEFLVEKVEIYEEFEQVK